MASVPLSFRPPESENIAALLIYEAAAADGPFALIDTVVEIGEAPNYIDQYETTNATSQTNWFAIRWRDVNGALTGLSASIQGGTELAIHKLVERIELRDPDVSERVAISVAEYVMESYLNKDPYDSTISLSYRQLEGLTLLALAQVQIGQLVSSAGSTDGWTAGLVSMKSGTSTQSLDSLRKLMAEGARILGLGYSRVVQMAVPPIAGGFSEIVTADISRLMIEVE